MTTGFVPPTNHHRHLVSRVTVCVSVQWNRRWRHLGKVCGLRAFRGADSISQGWDMKGVLREGGGRDGGHSSSLALLWRAAYMATGWGGAVAHSGHRVDHHFHSRSAKGRAQGKVSFWCHGAALSPSYHTGDLIIGAVRRRKKTSSVIKNTHLTISLD